MIIGSGITIPNTKTKNILHLHTFFILHFFGFMLNKKIVNNCVAFGIFRFGNITFG